MTAREYLHMAKDRRYHWADRAIHWMEQQDLDDADRQCNSMDDALTLAFDFAETNEGYHYWADIHDLLIEARKAKIDEIQ
jgi:hypothetical protein